ncbi:protein farnesyltransferase subunit beta-like [Patiria miniata]|uniref:Protein farnesyltransferase subunit beta n=1 Tax=Patiria miniata TaxID=46514 RepID=A0A914B9Q3_PATMI|nr:protein farnesyltransferase subunit beta-like [Patiria miniata]
MASPRCVADPEVLEYQRFLDDGVRTHSSDEQINVEESVAEMFETFLLSRDDDHPDKTKPRLHRKRHINFLLKGLVALSESYECLDASRPWICYWILHSLHLLDQPVLPEASSGVVTFLARCQHPEGGFGGGPHQFAHLAPTYAAVLALMTVGTQEAYQVIDRPKLQSFLMRMRSPEGAFRMHDGGEVDVRGAYCAAVAARITNVATPEMFDGTAEWIASCQSYEGGFAGQPGMEAHGGYSFCSVAALVLLGHERLCDTEALLRWLSNRQMKYEGGFQGRTNKLVDGCYSFWQAGTYPLIHSILGAHKDAALSATDWIFDQMSLQEYILLCCQHKHGGLVDKPGKARDFYHTCYCLSGLSVAQHFAAGKLAHKLLMGPPENELKQSHPLYNIGLEPAYHANQYFATLAVPK